MEEIKRLKRMRWSELERAALEAGLSLAAIDKAATRDELRLSILRAQFPAVEVECA
jgi:hypothetical protein